MRKCKKVQDFSVGGLLNRDGVSSCNLFFIFGFFLADWEAPARYVKIERMPSRADPCFSHVVLYPMKYLGNQSLKHEKRYLGPPDFGYSNNFA